MEYHLWQKKRTSDSASLVRSTDPKIKRYISIFNMHGNSNFSSIKMETEAEVVDIWKQEKCNILIENKNTAHFFNTFKCFYMNTKLTSKSSVAVGVSQLSRFMIYH